MNRKQKKIALAAGAIFFALVGVANMICYVNFGVEYRLSSTLNVIIFIIVGAFIIGLKKMKKQQQEQE